MSERDNKLEVIRKFTELNERVDKLDRYYYYINTERKRPSLIVMELSPSGNGYINGRYVNTDSFKTTKLGDINIKTLADHEIISLIQEAIHNINLK